MNKSDTLWALFGAFIVLSYGCNLADIKVVGQANIPKQTILSSVAMKDLVPIGNTKTNIGVYKPYIGDTYQIDIDPTWPTKLYLQTSNDLKIWNDVADTGTNQYFANWKITTTNDRPMRFYRVRVTNYPAI